MTDSSPLRINAQILIPRQELRFSFVRSSGPGGQNVNKVSSKAVLRWSAKATVALPEAVHARLLQQCARRLTDRGELVITSQRYRDQGRNIEDCLEKLRSLIVSAATVPKKRKQTRVPKGAREERLKQKRAVSEKKTRRRIAPHDD